MTELINGRAIRKAVIDHYQQHRDEIARLGRRILVIQVEAGPDDDEEWQRRCQASGVSARAKHDTFAALGYAVDDVTLPADVPPSALRKLINAANSDQAVSGTIVQMPVPIRLTDAVGTIDASKDLDQLAAPLDRAICATADGMTRLALPHITAESTLVVHGGRGFVGSGIVQRLKELGHDPSVVDRGDDPTPLRRTDIVFSTVGKAHCLTPELVGDREVPLIIDSGFTPTRSGIPSRSGTPIPLSQTGHTS